MKKFIYLSCLCSLLSFTGYGKEYVPEPIVLKEIEKQIEAEEYVFIPEDNYVNIYLKLGTDFYRSFEKIGYGENSFNKKDADSFAWEIAMEGTKEIYPNFELGVGIAYQAHGKPKSEKGKYDLGDELGYSSIPLYLTGKYNFMTLSPLTPYIKTNLGYSYNSSSNDTEVFSTSSDISDIDVKHGLYYGLGAGIEYNDFIMELMYQVNEAKGEVKFNNSKAVKDNLDYKRVTLSLGYKF